MKYRHVLKGCRTEPLLSYLKAMGILRILSKQTDPEIRGFWVGGEFVIETNLETEELTNFLFSEYVPSPIVVPWSGKNFLTAKKEYEKISREIGSDGVLPDGRFPVEKPSEIARLIFNPSPRFELYRKVIIGVFGVVDRLNLRDFNEMKKRKAEFVAALRSILPDEVIPWLDAATSIRSSDKLEFQSNKLLGSGGGNDGHTHFSANFMKNIITVFPEFADEKEIKKRDRQGVDIRKKRLEDALWGGRFAALEKGYTPDLFHAGGVGGANATTGEERPSFTNPWDFIFALEGVLTFAGAVTKRYGLNTEQQSIIAFPFIVKMTPAGVASIATPSAGDMEVWLPIWSRPATYGELSYLFAMGRADAGRKTAYSGLSFAEAVSGLGVDSGIDYFQRFGIIKGRRGGEKYYISAHLGNFRVDYRPESDALFEVDRFLEGIRIKNLPASTMSLIRRIKDAELKYCAHGRMNDFSDIIILLGKLERNLAVKSGLIPDGKSSRPITLSGRWFHAVREDSVEFRIAASLSQIGRNRWFGKDKQEDPEPIRAFMEPVSPKGNRYLFNWSADSGNSVDWVSGILTVNLSRILERRIIKAKKTGKGSDPFAFRKRSIVKINDIALFLEGQTDDSKIEDFLWALNLVDFHIDEEDEKYFHDKKPFIPIPRIFALLKMLFLPRRHSRRLTGGNEIPIELGNVESLLAGNLKRVAETAVFRLRASGRIVMPGPYSGGGRRYYEFNGIAPDRLSAALLIPLNWKEIFKLERLILRKRTDAEIFNNSLSTEGD